MDLFTLSATLGLDSEEYEKKIDEAIEKAGELKAALGEPTVTGGESDLSQSIEEAAQQTDTFGSTVKGILASDVIRRGADAMVDFGKRSVETASDLKEVQNVVDVTFGDMSARVDAWAKTTKDGFGLTELQSKRYASRLGSMMKTAGLELSEVFDMSTSLTELTGDLASFFDTDFDAVYEKLQSGMSGQVRPLRDFGLDMTVSHLTDYAHEQGLEGKWQDLSEADQYRMRYGYLLSHTQDVQGDFARTSGSAANELRTFENNVDALAAKIGDKFLPMIEAGTHAANGFFDTLMNESTDDALAGINAAAESTAVSIEATARQANAAIGVLEDLGDRSALTGEQQEQWDSVMGQLLRTIPDLSALVNEQTGEIEGGTDALRKNVAAWAESGKAAADTSALQAKQDMLADTSAAIAEEEAQIAIAQKAVEDASASVIALGAMVASELGQSFDGTTQGARELMDTLAGWGALEALGFNDASVAALLAPLDQAEASLSAHQQTLEALEEKYKTVQDSIGGATQSMSQSVADAQTDISESFEQIDASLSEHQQTLDALKEKYSAVETDIDGAAQGISQSVADAQGEIGESFGQIEADTDDAVANFNQSAAAQGLNDAYPAYAAAANRYAKAGRSFSTSSSTTSRNADGLSYVPYNDYLSYLHKGEAVLTAAQAEDWRAGRTGNAGATVDANAIARAVAQAITGLSVQMDGQTVGHIVAPTVSSDIASGARSARRYAVV